MIDSDVYLEKSFEEEKSSQSSDSCADGVHDSEFEEAASSFTDASVEFINEKVASLNSSQQAAMGRAYQAISQSMSLTIQDATDNLRNFSTVNLAALSYAQQQLVATKDLEWVPIINNLQAALEKQISSFSVLSQGAGNIIKDFVEEDNVNSPDHAFSGIIRTNSEKSEETSCINQEENVHQKNIREDEKSFLFLLNKIFKKLKIRWGGYF